MGHDLSVELKKDQRQKVKSIIGIDQDDVINGTDDDNLIDGNGRMIVSSAGKEMTGFTGKMATMFCSAVLRIYSAQWLDPQSK